jgi:hypothetical protein
VSAHTPGPWHIGGKGSTRATLDTNAPRVWGPDGAGVAELLVRRRLGEPGPSAVEVANARLIAAAPDLWSVCEAVAVFPCRRRDGNCSMLPVKPCHTCRARAAIAKARGSHA